MKKILKHSLALAALSAFTLCAQDGNIIKFGDFENLPAGRTGMVASMKKSGVDINRDPVSFTPGWYKGKTKPSIQIIQATDADKSVVKSGNFAMKVKAEMIHMYTPAQFPLGTYDLSFAYKGTGKLDVSLYFYSAAGKLLGSERFKGNIVAGADWRMFNEKINITTKRSGAAKARLVLIFKDAEITVDDIVLKPAESGK